MQITYGYFIIRLLQVIYLILGYKIIEKKAMIYIYNATTMILLKILITYFLLEGIIGMSYNYIIFHIYTTRAFFFHTNF